MNPLCFISRLPDEILQAIFIQSAHDYFHEHSGRPISTAPSWVDVSYVSHHWRGVALDCSSLWTYFFVTSPRWTEVLLARSRRALFRLKVTLSSLDQERRGLRFLEQVMDHVERVQDLHLDLANDPQYSVLSKLAARARRFLHLSITLPVGDRSNRSPLHLGGDALALRMLHLEHCLVSLSLLKLDDLTKLSLKYGPLLFQQNTPELLAALGHMHNLRCLSLHNALTGGTGFLSSAGFRSFQKISLPHLSQLSIFDRLSTIIALLSCIIIPWTTEIVLGPDFCPEYASSLEAYAPLYTLLKQRYSVVSGRAASIPAIRSVAIENSEAPFGCTLVDFRTAERNLDRCFVSGNCPDSSCGGPLRVSLAHRRLVFDREHILSCVCSSMPLSQVQSVHVRNPSPSVVLWTDILPDLRYLKLSGGFMPGLTSQLWFSLTPCNLVENKAEHSDSDRGHTLVPALEELELCDVAFLTAVDDAPSKNADFKSLCDALSTRTAPRGRLTLSRCIERGSDLRLKCVDLEGRWGDGQFFIVFCEEKDCI